MISQASRTILCLFKQLGGQMTKVCREGILNRGSEQPGLNTACCSCFPCRTSCGDGGWFCLCGSGGRPRQDRHRTHGVLDLAAAVAKNTSTLFGDYVAKFGGRERSAFFAVYDGHGGRQVVQASERTPGEPLTPLLQAQQSCTVNKRCISASSTELKQTRCSTVAMTLLHCIYYIHTENGIDGHIPCLLARCFHSPG